MGSRRSSARVGLIRRRTIRAFSVLAMVAAIALTVVSSASAANLAPNPGFEDACGSPTKACFWLESMNPSFGDTYRDTSVAHAGVASYKTRLNGAYFGQFGRTDCIAPPPTAPGKTVTMSFWYLTTDTRITSIELSDRYWSTAACSSSAVGSLAQASAPLADGRLCT